MNICAHSSLYYKDTSPYRNLGLETHPDDLILT